MRKTTNPKERKYTPDREFNTFGRGAIEDAPPEMLYGKGAVARAFNVNCHQGYLEGRTGSKVFSRSRTAGAKLAVGSSYNDAGEEVVNYADVSGARLWEWHDILKLWVRLEGNCLSVAGWDIKEWEAATAVGDVRLLNDVEPFIPQGRCSFVKTATGGIIYHPQGIFRWVYRKYDVEGIQDPLISNSVFRVNIPWPVKVKSENNRTTYDGQYGNPISDGQDHVYRYLLTGSRIIGKSRLEGGIVELETPTSDHGNFDDGYGVRTQDAIRAKLPEYDSEEPIKIENLGNNSNYLDDNKQITHISVYRTLDLEASEIDDEGREIFNNPQRFGLVADMPLALCVYGQLVKVDGSANAYDLIPLKENLKACNFKLWDLFTVVKFRPENYSTLTPDEKKKHDNTTYTIHGVYDSGWRARVFAYRIDNNVELPNSSDNVGGAIVSDNARNWFMGSCDYNRIRVLDSSVVGEAGSRVYLSNGEAYTVVSIYDNYIYVDRTIDGGSRPLAVVVDIRHGREIFFDRVDDDTLRARMADWYPRTRFRLPLPNCNVAAAVPGFILAAVEDESKLYYVDDDGAVDHICGSYNPIQINEQVKDGIRHIEAFPDAAAIFASASTWKYAVGTSTDLLEAGSGRYVPLIPMIELVDNTIGCADAASVRRVSGGAVLLVTRESDAPAVRFFDGHRYGENLLEDTGLNLRRNVNRIREYQHFVAIYGDACGYIVWCAKSVPDVESGERRSPAGYCFRLATKGAYGGGQSEYGGEDWLWPDALAAAVAVGSDPDGNRVTFVEYNGVIYRIGAAEQWLDRETEWGAGKEIPTSVSLPVIADGYKWVKHLETHIAMRCWRHEYRGAAGHTADGFRDLHRVSIKIYEDGEQVAESAALLDLNRNGDYAYLNKVDARRIQEVISTTTSAYKISQVITTVQISDREALPVDNRPAEVNYQIEWSKVALYLSRNLPYIRCNRADGKAMELCAASGGEPKEADAPTGRAYEALTPGAGMEAQLSNNLTQFTASLWIKPAGPDCEILCLKGEGGQALVVEYFNGHIRCYIIDGVVLSGVVLPGVAVPTGSWSHVLFIRPTADSEYDSVAVYVNEDQKAVVPCQSSVGNIVSVAVGRGAGADVEMFDVRVIEGCVSEGSISAYYAAVKRSGARGAEGWLP